MFIFLNKKLFSAGVEMEKPGDSWILCFIARGGWVLLCFGRDNIERGGCRNKTAIRHAFNLIGILRCILLLKRGGWVRKS